MSDEVELNASLRYDDSEGTETFLELVEGLFDVTTKKVTRLKQNVGTTEEALLLGDVSSLGWVLVINRDATNYVNVKTGTSGTIFAKIPPGAPLLLHFGSGVTAPYVIADTAACDLDILLISQ